MPAHYLEIILVVASLLIIFIDAFASKSSKIKVSNLTTAIAGLALAYVIATLCTYTAQLKSQDLPEPTLLSNPLSDQFLFDQFTIFFKVFFAVCSLLVVLLANHVKTTVEGVDKPYQGAFDAILLLVCAGMMWLASAKDIIHLFVALELVAIGFYVLISFWRSQGELEAGIKYLILGGVSTAILVYGLSWLYGTSGHIDINYIFSITNTGAFPIEGWLLGFILVLIAISFKVGSFPFQLWIPDVYQGANTPTTALLSVASKAAGLMIFYRLVTEAVRTDSLQYPLLIVLTVVIIATLLIGNLGALAQQNIKRLFAYSSIAQAGFLLIPILGLTDVYYNKDAISAAFFLYLIAYLIATMSAFFCLAAVEKQRESSHQNAFSGLGRTNPGLALAMTIALSSLAGLPLTIGFQAKINVFALLIEQQEWLIFVMALLGAVASFYYYFKVLRAIYWNNETTEQQEKITVPLPYSIVLVISSILILYLGIFIRELLPLLP